MFQDTWRYIQFVMFNVIAKIASRELKYCINQIGYNCRDLKNGSSHIAFQILKRLMYVTCFWDEEV